MDLGEPNAQHMQQRELIPSSARKTLELVDPYGLFMNFFQPIPNSRFMQCVHIERDLLISVLPNYHDTKLGDYDVKTYAHQNEVRCDVTWPDISSQDFIIQHTEPIIRLGFASTDDLPIYLESNLFDRNTVTFFVIDEDKLVDSFSISKDELAYIGRNTHPGDKQWWKHTTREEINALYNRLRVHATLPCDLDCNTQLLTQFRCATINAHIHTSSLPDYAAQAYFGAKSTMNPEIIATERQYLLRTITNPTIEASYVDRMAAIELLIRVESVNTSNQAEYEAAVNTILEEISSNYPFINSFNKATEIISGLRLIGKASPIMSEFISNFFNSHVHNRKPLDGHFLLLSIIQGLVTINPVDDSLPLYKRYIDEYLYSPTGRTRIFEQASEFSRLSARALLTFIEHVAIDICNDTEFLVHRAAINAWATYIAGTQQDGFGIKNSIAINAMKIVCKPLEQFPNAQRNIARRFAEVVAESLGSDFESFIVLQDRVQQINLIAHQIFPAVSVGYQGDNVFFSRYLLINAAQAITVQILRLCARTCTSIYDDNIVLYPQLVIEELRKALIALTNGFGNQVLFIEKLKDDMYHKVSSCLHIQQVPAIAAEFLEECIVKV